MEVSPEIALECMANFTTIIESGDIEKIKAAYSASVSFDTPSVAEWLNSNGYLNNTANFQVSFGIYTENAAKELGIPQSAGRLTAFVWPLKVGTAASFSNSREEAAAADRDNPDGEPTFAPYNVGSLTP